MEVNNTITYYLPEKNICAIKIESSFINNSKVATMALAPPLMILYRII